MDEPRDGKVEHHIAQLLFDLAGDLSALADHDEAFEFPTRQSDQFERRSPSYSDSRDRAVANTLDLFDPYLHIDTLEVKRRNLH